mmetsp:Transcript_4263/g.8731  ORF Transcript_4263/g.8731 Transcript_4263/m.8731 type:complete len:848 (-) Transcript_4263:146-2689(-)
MFRKIKKKPVNVPTKRSLDDTAESETPSTSAEQQDPITTSASQIFMQKKKQRSGPTMGAGIRAATTFSNRPSSSEPASTVNRTTVRVQKRPRSTGLGFGGSVGGGVGFVNQNTPISDNTSRDTSSQTNRYDANSLSQLRQQQDVFQPQQVTPDDWNPPQQSQSLLPGGVINQDTGSGGWNENSAQFFKANDNTNDDEDDFGRNFIPIDENPDSIQGEVLNGDEAMVYAAKDSDANRSEAHKPAGPTMDSVVGRFGGGGGGPLDRESGPRGGGTTSGTFKPNLYSHQTSPNANLSLTFQDVHQHFSQTQERLKIQADALEKALIRREEAKLEAKGQVEKHRQDIKSTGSSLEFYQAWRRDLIAFVGALREITKALPEMQTAWHELEQDMAGIQKWKDWEDDTVGVLARYNLLQSVVGRQPDTLKEVLTGQHGGVDEFGRDIVSQKERILLQRRLERRKTRKEAVVESGVKNKMGSESGHEVSVPPHLDTDYAYPTGYPVLAGPTEMETFRERNKALQEALKVALDSLYQEYTSLQQLFELFAQWKRSFPAEYKECYASLTLADLATVLIQVELLSLNDPLNESGGHDEAKWITTVCRFYDCEKQRADDCAGPEIKLFDKESIERLVSKAVLPTLQDLLSQKRTYNLLSARQSKALSAFLSNAQRLLPRDHPVLRILHKVVVDYIQQALQELSVPLIYKQTAVMERLDKVQDPEEKELFGQTVHDATIGQIERVKKIMLNLIDCWAKLLPSESGFPVVILQFMSSKVVPLLSALQTWHWPSLAESPADVFAQLWREVQKYDWLDRPESALHGTVLKATAAAFRVDAADKGPGDELMGDLASDPIIQQAS